MSRIVILDTSPLGMASNPKASPENTRCQEWLNNLLAQKRRVLIPEIADYEVRRELLRLKKQSGLTRLDRLCATLEYIPLTTASMRLAASYWATARQQGTPTASDKALDADVILAAQAVLLDLEPDQFVIATTNVKHLTLFAPAELWADIV